MITRDYVDSVMEEFSHLLRNEVFEVDKSGCRVLEVRAASFCADEDSIFGEVDASYVQRELEWYKSQSLNVNDFPGGAPTIWKQVANRHGEINSNYGYRIWSAETGSQYRRVLDELKANPSSRRAVMIYTCPEMHHLYDFDGMSDFICTNAAQYLVRYGILHAIVQMRSSDAVFGYKNDRAWHQHVLTELAGELGVQAGRITWQAGSLHVYERHFYLVDNYGRTGERSVKRSVYDERYPSSPWRARREVAQATHGDGQARVDVEQGPVE